MAAYVISEVEIIDEEAAESYKQLASVSIETYGGRYIVRGAEAHMAEGQAAKGRIVIVEFPSLQRVHEWYTSKEYAKALEFRDTALNRRLFFAEGLEDGKCDKNRR